MKAIVFDNYIDKFDSINKYLNIEKVNFEIIKFKNGEGKVIIKDDIENENIIIFSDFHNKTSYKYLGKLRTYSKDEYYVELKRVISALDNVKSISVFLPLIYQSRQNSNNKKESKDYLMFIEDLKHLGVSSIVTFEAHGEDDNIKSYSLSPLFKDYKYDVVVSPDKGGVKRSKEYSKIMKCDNYHFLKTRDLAHIIDGSNPISEYGGKDYNFKDKKVLIVDDILDSGNTLLKALDYIRDANRVDVFVAYPLFSNGIKEFKNKVKENKLDTIYVSNLINIDRKIIKNKFIKVIECEKLVSKVINEVIE